MRRSARVGWALWAACVAWAGAAASLLPLDAEHLSASVGGYAVFNCHLDFPFGNEIPYHLQWDKDVSTALPCTPLQLEPRASRGLARRSASLEIATYSVTVCYTRVLS